MMPLHEDEEVEALKARVKELESLLSQRCDGIDCDRGEECVELQKQLNAANADRARLRESLRARVRHHEYKCDCTATTLGDAVPPCSCGVDEGRRVLDSTDASQWLRERERRVAERVFAKCVGVAVSTGPCKEHRYQCELDQTVDAIVDALKAIDLDALLKEET